MRIGPVKRAAAVVIFQNAKPWKSETIDVLVERLVARAERATSDVFATFAHDVQVCADGMRVDVEARMLQAANPEERATIAEDAIAEALAATAALALEELSSGGGGGGGGGWIATDALACRNPACNGSRDGEYIRRQQRSADEPETLIWRCRRCKRQGGDTMALSRWLLGHRV